MPSFLLSELYNNQFINGLNGSLEIGSTINLRMKKSTSSPLSERLESLDILRGTNLFFLELFEPVYNSFAKQLDNPITNKILGQFFHKEWAGSSLWDLVMPLFLFMAGISMPFSFSKYKGETNQCLIYRKIIKRAIILFILGAIVQGNLLSLDCKQIHLYSNALQAIATGYLIASILLLNFSRKGQIIATTVLLLIYWLPMTLLGDFTPTGNFAERVDQLILGRFRDGVYWDANGLWHFSPQYSYTWIFSSLTFGVTVMLGCFAGQIIRKGKENRKLVVRKLLTIGAGLVAVSLLWSLQIPIINKLWTSSMALFTGGVCFLLIGIFYYWIDYKGHTYGLSWLKIYGMNSITAYLIGEVVNFRCAVDSVSHGLEQFLGRYYPTWLSLGNYLIVFFILRIMYKQKIFLKI